MSGASINLFQSNSKLAIPKDNIVDIEIIYPYVPGSEPLLEKYLKLTRDILRFK